MSTFKNPVGPQPSNVYWRRRLVVGLGLLAVIVIIVLIIARPGSGDSTPLPKPTGSSTAQASDSADGTTAGSGTCAANDIALVAVTDKVSYAAGEQPQLSLSITNTGSAACTLSVGTDVQEYRITSGADVIWSSKDCQTDSTPLVTTLEPNVATASTPFAWDRTRSAADTCDGERPTVPSAGASYHLTVVVGELTADETRQFLLY